MTWRDDVELGDPQTPAHELPAWKLTFNEGDQLVLCPSRPEARPVRARVVFSTSKQIDWQLPVLVQVEIRLGDGPPVELTTIPATAVLRHWMGGQETF